MLSDGTPHTLGCDGHLQMGDAEIGQRVDDGIDDDAERRGNAAFAAAAKPQRVGRGRDFADRGRKAWQVGGSRHCIIHERPREELAALGVVEALLEQRLAGALGDPAMGLTMQDERVDGAADIVDGGVADDLDGPGLWVDLDFADMKPVREGSNLARDLADTGERPAQLLGETRVVLRHRRDSEQVERAVGTGDGEMPVDEINVGLGCLEPV